MSGRASPRLVGAFVLIAIGLAVMGIIIFSSGTLFSQKERFVVYFDGSLAGLNRGAPVKYRGVQIGMVTDVLFNIIGHERPAGDLRLPVLLEVDEKLLLARGATVDMGDPVFVDSLIDRGFRATLAVESFVTGRRYIELGEYPGTPYELTNDPDMEPGVLELPSHSVEGLGDIAARADEFLGNLAAVDVAALVDRLTGVVEQLSEVAAAPALNATIDSLPGILGNINSVLASYDRVAREIDTTIVPVRIRLDATLEQATQTLSEIESTFSTMETVMAPGSPLTHQLEAALIDFGRAAQALRNFTEYLERNPSSILRGKPEERR
jgi:paraquat-inducible protein B